MHHTSVIDILAGVQIPGVQSIIVLLTIELYLYLIVDLHFNANTFGSLPRELGWLLRD